jgi:hypothetical protein
MLREIGEDAPVVALVGVGQCRACHAPAKAHMIQLAADGSEASLDVSQALAVGQLGERHGQKLVPAGEAAMVRVAPIPRNASLKLVPGQIIHDLGEHSLSGIHPPLSKIRPPDRQSATRVHPNQFKSKNPNPPLSHSF